MIFSNIGGTTELIICFPLLRSFHDSGKWLAEVVGALCGYETGEAEDKPPLSGIRLPN